MNRPRDDEYDSLRDLMGGGTQQDPDSSPDDPADSDARGDLPPGVPPEYAEAYRRGYESALRGEEPRVGKHTREPNADERPADERPADERPAGERPAGERPADVTPGDAAPGDEPTIRIDRDQVPAPEPATAEPRPAEPSLEEPTRAVEHPSAGSTGDEPARAVEHPPAGSTVDEPARAVEHPPVGSTSDEPTRAVEPPPAGSTGDEPTQQIPVTQAAPAPSYDAPAPSYDDHAAEDRSGVAPPPSYDESAPSDEDRRKRLMVIGIAVLAVLLVVGAFGIGRLVSGGGDSGEDSSSEAGGSSKPVPYEGPVDSVTVAGATASCQTENSVDGAGNVVSYEPAKAYDSNLATAWRCDGSGQGQRFTVDLPEETTVAEVGLVPGYAKTDPASGVDRYAENNRITKVRWRFDDGSTYVQRMNGNPTDRDMRTMRVPETSTKRVVIEILASKPGPRNTVAISELRVATPSG